MKHTLNVDKEARQCANLGQRWSFDHLKKIFQTCSTAAHFNPETDRYILVDSNGDLQTFMESIESIEE